MPRLLLLRHAMTRGNLERRWTGTTDEPLCPEGVALARRCARPAEEAPRRVWVSPLLRCRQTAAILWPDAELIPVPALRETDFGPFENKNHQELAGDPVYEAWIRSAGEAPVPGMESREAAAARAVPAVRAIIGELVQSGEDGAVVTHGGVVMAACERLAEPAQDYEAVFITGGCRQGEGFFRPARQKTAGILGVFQGFLTQQGGKRPALTASAGCEDSFYYRWWVRCCGGWLLDLSGWPRTGKAAVIRGIEPPMEVEG